MQPTQYQYTHGQRSRRTTSAKITVTPVPATLCTQYSEMNINSCQFQWQCTTQTLSGVLRKGLDALYQRKDRFGSRRS
eukprot:scaffold9107_cov77-Skeletonema_marinoi.AAC.4